MKLQIDFPFKHLATMQPMPHTFRLSFPLLALSLCLLLASCGKRPDVPTQYTQSQEQPVIFPDYTDVTVPPNIAPLNFKVLMGAKECVARVTDAEGATHLFGEGNKVCFSADEWSAMLAGARGKSLKVEIFARKAEGGWTLYKPFQIEVAEEDIDPYISYRAIPPSYVAYEVLSINQRSMSSFAVHEIYNNMIISHEGGGQCINCHSYQNYGTANMQFHMRQEYGGTMIVRDGRPYKIDMKSDSTISAGVYPAWHPTLPLIAYSTNSTGQSFHTKSRAKIEVEDSRSDLILLDVDRNEISNICADTTEFECFPTWSPDGKYLYYGSAHFEYSDTMSRETEVIERYQDIHYSLYRKAFNAQTRTFGPAELVYDADTLGKSATFPRVSPDGRYLLFAQANYGCFHVWHPDADLYVLNLATRQARPLTRANSPEAESYHAWSSNGRWIMFISRRDDGNYSRLYFSYFDKQGHEHKAFELPQRDPDFYDFYQCSFNVPEFMKEPVSVSPQQFASAAKKDGKKVTFVSRPSGK